MDRCHIERLADAITAQRIRLSLSLLAGAALIPIGVESTYIWIGVAGVVLVVVSLIRLAWCKDNPEREHHDDLDSSKGTAVGKGLAGLDEHQVRRWDSWHRWVTLARLAAAFLTITAAAEHASGPPPDGQIPLTRNEISHLLAALILQPAQDARYLLRWSGWRGRHQHHARTGHYQRQAREP